MKDCTHIKNDFRTCKFHNCPLYYVFTEYDLKNHICKFRWSREMNILNDQVFFVRFRKPEQFWLIVRASDEEECRKYVDRLKRERGYTHTVLTMTRCKKGKGIILERVESEGGD